MAQHRKLDYSAELVPMLRKIGRVYDLTEDERKWIMEGDGERFEGFCGFFVEMRNAGGPEDERYHMRTFFGLLREQIQRHGDIATALAALDYEDVPAERGYWEDCGRAERSNVVQLRADWQRGRGVR